MEIPVDIPPDRGYNKSIEVISRSRLAFCQLLKEVTALFGWRGGCFLFSLVEITSL